MDGIHQRHLIVKNEAYTALIMSLCKKGNLKDPHGCWEFAQRNKWLPGLEDCKALVGCLCQQEMLVEALQLLECMLVYNPHLGLDIFSEFLETLCVRGSTGVAHLLLDEILNYGCILDHTAFSHVVRGLCKEKNFSVVFTILDNMLCENLAPSWHISVLLIPKLCRAGRYEKSIALKEIGLREQSSYSFPLHCALMKGFCMTGNIQEVSTLFQEMFLKGLLPDTEIYNMMIRALSSEKHEES